jgi:hypothetical protein
MFYTESITIKSQKNSIWSRIVRYFEKIGTARAQRELQRLGYTQKYLESLEQKFHKLG